jgi:hypothetical protein
VTGPRGLDDGGCAVAGGPGALARTVAARLSADGFLVAVPAHEDATFLAITGPPGLGITLMADDDGRVRLDAWPATLRRAAPAVLARQVMSVLDEDRADWVPGTGEFRADAPLTGPMGRLLRTAGLAVSLTVLEDTPNFDVYPVITAARPGQAGRGTVSIDDDGTLTWECRHPVTADTTARVAGQIADTAARVIRAGLPGTWAGQRPGLGRPGIPFGPYRPARPGS